MRSFIAILFFAASVLVYAQGPQQRQPFSPEHYRAELEKFVSCEACLSPAEAQALFPLYHEMMGKIRNNEHQARSAMWACNDASTEAQFQAAIEKSLALEIENKKIEKEYYKRFHSFLSWKKIHKVRVALVKFNMIALRRFTPGQNPGQNRPRGRH